MNESNEALTPDQLRRARLLRDSDYVRGTPIYCVWEITLACDLGCKHCGSRAGKARPGELDTAAALDVVRELDELGVREVTLIGGEAYLREDWDVLAAEITRRGMNCSITTGARNLSPERLARAVAAGVGAISISVDGLEKTHDAQRGVKGAWAAATEAARRVAATPIRVSFNTQINRLSLPELPSVAALLAEVGGKAWQLQLTVPMGRAADRPGLLLQPYELLELFPLLVWMRQNVLDPAGIELFLGNNIGYFSPYEAILRYQGQLGGHWTGCSAGKWTLGLEADGKIKGCPSLPSVGFTGGYLGRDKLDEVIAKSAELRMLRERTVEDLWGFCRSCYYADTCKGGCSWMATMLFKRTGNNPYCIHRALELEAKGLRERVVRVEAAPGLPFDQGLFEIVVEAMPEGGAEATIAGFRAADVIAASGAGMWEAEVLRERLLKV